MDLMITKMVKKKNTVPKNMQSATESIKKQYARYH